eukprot:Sspe_Gene.77320::Locus_48300_Transcript_1_1_Confidence_1.000_Length_1369::g.77320::m.77320
MHISSVHSLVNQLTAAGRVEAFLESLREVYTPSTVRCVLDLLHMRAVSEANGMEVAVKVIVKLADSFPEECRVKQHVEELCKATFRKLRILRRDPEDEDGFREARFQKVANAQFIARLFNVGVVCLETVLQMARDMLCFGEDVPLSDDDIESLRDLLVISSKRLHELAPAAMQGFEKMLESSSMTHPDPLASNQLQNLICSITNIDTKSNPLCSSLPSTPDEQRRSSEALSSPKGRKGQAQREPAVRKTIYAVGIDSKLTEEEFLAFLSQCGKLEKARLCGDTSNPTVYGFFQYSTRAEAEALMAMSGMQLGNYILNLSWARAAIRDTRSQKDTRDLLDKNRTAKVEVRQSVLTESNWQPRLKQTKKAAKAHGGKKDQVHDLSRETSTDSASSTSQPEEHQSYSYSPQFYPQPMFGSPALM